MRNDLDLGACRVWFKGAGRRPRSATRAAIISQPSGYTASFSSLAARNATFLLALILIASPVAGLRPIRAGRFLT